VDEVERLIHRYHSCAAAASPARLDILLELRRHADARIVPFLLRVLLDRDEAPEVRVTVVRQLRSIPLKAADRPPAARAIARVLVDGGDAGLRLHAASALACFAHVEGIPTALGNVALDPGESVDLRFATFSSLERADATPESVSLVRRLVADETLGRAASALLASWRVE
jgi:hypothetical protein